MRKLKDAITKENAAKVTFGLCAAFSIFAVFAIIVFVHYRSIPAFREVGVFNFIFGTGWKPTWEDKAWNGEYKFSDIFGVAPMIVTSFAVTGGSVLFGGLLGVFTAVFMAFYCPKNLQNVPVLKKIPILNKLPLKGIFEQIINLLASIPSIIIGFFGLVVIVPLVRDILPPHQTGTGVLSAIIVLSIMIMPTIASLAKNSLEAASKEYYEGSLGLGNTKDQTVFRVMLPAAKSGVLSAIILGVGRAVGETIAVYFVIGGTPGNFPETLYTPVASLTTTIVLEMGYASPGSIHESALIATGFVLLVFVLLINLALNVIKRDKAGGNKLFGGKIGKHRAAEKVYVYKQRGASQKVLKYISIVLSLFIAFVLTFLVLFICVKGIPHLNLHFLFGESRNGDETLLPAFVSTGLIIFMTLLIALPLGIGAAIFLNEYSKKGSRFVKTVRLFIDTLAGVPSIVFGLFGMIFFCNICGLGYSLWAGSFTMVLIVLPTVIRSTEESLREVPDSMREGSLALGSSKVRTIFKIVLPSALRGIVTSVILSIGRIVGESAALIYTAGSSIRMPSGYGGAGSTFAVMMYRFQVEGLAMEKMYATAVVLLAIVVILDLLVTLVQKKFARKANGEERGAKTSRALRKDTKRNAVAAKLAAAASENE